MKNLRWVRVLLVGLTGASVSGAQTEPASEASDERWTEPRARALPPRPAAKANADAKTVANAAGVTEAPPENPSLTWLLNAGLKPGAVPLSPNQAATLAVATSPALDEARAAVAAASAGAAKASIGLYPRLEVSAHYGYINAPVGQISTPTPPASQTEAARQLAEAVTDPAARELFLANIDQQENGQEIRIAIPPHQMGVELGVTYPISDVFFAILPAMKAAEGRELAQRQHVAATRSDVRLSAYETYYQYARARGAHAVTVAAKHEADEQLALVKAMSVAGLATEADLLVAEAHSASMDEAIVNARGGVDLAGASLGILIGIETDIPEFAIADALGDTPPLPLASLNDLTAEALRTRPELEAMRIVSDAQSETIAATRAQAYPHIAGYAKFDYSNPNPRVIPPIQIWQKSYEAGVVLKWSPSDLALGIDESRGVAASKAETLAQIRGLERGIRLQVQQAWQRWKTALESTASAHARLVASKEAYEARKVQYRAGEALITEVLATETALSRARLSVLDAIIATYLAQAQLRHATGRLSAPLPPSERAASNAERTTSPPQSTP